MISVYIVNGPGGSGKSSFETMVMSHSKGRGYVTSMVEIVKFYAQQMGWDGGKEDKDRKFLSDLKDCLTDWADIPYQYVVSRVEEFNQIESCSYCFIDAREGKDIDRLKEELGLKGYKVQTVLVDRGIMREYGNHADDGAMDYSYDITIGNQGSLKDLDSAAAAFCLTEEI